MAVVKPFLCVRPKQELVSRVAALPYDVYNRQEACDEVKKEPLSFLKIDRAETQFDDSVDTYDARVYLKAKELLEVMIADGTFVSDEESAYFIYELTMDSRIQTGIVACSSIDDYNNNVIKKHENTRADKEIDRITHVDTCNAQTGPIFLAYRDNIVIDQEVEKARKNDPIYNFTSDDNIKHTVWKISAIDSIDKIQKAFATINEIYIADGHHRAASAVKVGMQRREANPAFTGQEEYNFFLSVLFPDEQLMIMPYNRVVKDLNGDSKEVFLKKVSKNFTIEKKTEKVSPSRKATFGMYFDHEWYLLTANKDIILNDPVKGLDASILQDNLLAPILGIIDPKTDKKIDFVGGIRGLEELERRAENDMKIAFSMYPTSIGELFAVADADKLMPPKSTWFEPKLRSGIFIHRI